MSESLTLQSCRIVEFWLSRANTAALDFRRLMPENDNKKAGQYMTGHWRDRATTGFISQKKPATGIRGMVVSNHPLASSAGEPAGSGIAA